MSQCVPSWDLDNNSCPSMLPNCSGLNLSEPVDVPVWDNHVTELAWENGQLSMHGFVKANPSRSVASSPNMKHVNLESLHEGLSPDDLVPWLDGFCSPPQSIPMDAMVPCYLPAVGPQPFEEKSVGCDTHSASGSVTFERTAKDKPSVQPDAAFHVSQAYDYKDYVDLDSIYPQPSEISPDDQKKKNGGKSSSSAKRCRVAAVHNLSERKRRDRINQRIKTLQGLVPNSTKTDKVSILDEVIEYVKQLKADAQAKEKPAAVSASVVPSQQRLPVPLLGPMGVGVGMELGIGLVGMNSVQRPVVPSLPAPLLHPSVFMPLQGWDGSAGPTLFPTPPIAVLPDPLSAFFKSQALSMDAFYRQLSYQPASASKN